MTRFEFILVTAATLMVAFALGWAAHWLITRFTRVSQDDLGELDRMAQALHDAEETRDNAIAWIEQRESEFAEYKARADAELRAAMDGLREARQESGYLQAQLEERDRQNG